jgi:chromosome partitioning protein
VLIPSKANEADAKGAMRTHAHVKSVAESMDKSITSYVVMMDIDSHTNITQSIIDALDAHEVPRLESMCGHRTGFKEMTSTGGLPTGAAKQEAQKILAELQQNNRIDYYRGPKWEKSA